MASHAPAWRRMAREPGDSAETLAARVRAREHVIYPIAARWFTEGRLSLEGDRALLDDEVLPAGGLDAESC